MCMNSETVEALHAVTSELKAINEHRDDWLKSADADGIERLLPLPVARAEAELIFTARREAIEARLKELGWSRTIRVESNPIAQPQRLNAEPG